MKINFYTRLIIILNEPTNKYPDKGKQCSGKSKLKDTSLSTQNRNGNQIVLHKDLLASQISEKWRYYKETQQIKHETEEKHRVTEQPD